jgi:hypothetical protein
MQMRSSTPGWGLAAALLAVCAFALPASAQPRGKADKNGSVKADKNGGGSKADKNGAGSRADKNGAGSKADKNDKGDDSDSSAGDDKAPAARATKSNGKKDSPKTYDFNALDLNGRMRTPQLLYFLERANEELERASLEKRSFIPHMVRSVDEEAL